MKKGANSNIIQQLYRELAQLARVLALGARGSGFESRVPDQKFYKVYKSFGRCRPQVGAANILIILLLMEEELKDAALTLARHIHDGEYEALIISGGSNAVSKALLYGAWRTEYPEEKVPKIITIPSEGNALLYKYTAKDEDDRNAKVTEWLESNIPELLELKNSKICLIDEFAVTGEKAREITEVFSKLGFKNTEIALFSAGNRAELPENTFVARESNELTTRLWKAASRIEGHPFIEDSEVPEDNKQEIRNRGLEDLRGMMSEIRK